MMKKFIRTAGQTIWAYRWSKDMGESEGIVCNPENHPLMGSSYYCNTANGRVSVQDGDWILKDVKGRYYPCKPDVFEMTYMSEESVLDSTTFVEALSKLINHYSKENESNTPDFILAEYIDSCLKNAADLINRRERWRGKK